MHPVLALASRLFNTFELAGRLTAENLSRLRFSVEAVRSYLTDQGSADRQSAWTLFQHQRIYRLAIHRTGITAWLDYGIDLIGGIPKLSDLTGCPAGFIQSASLRCSAWSKGSEAPAPRAALQSGNNRLRSGWHRHRRGR